MKFKSLMTLCIAGAAVMSASAQTHVEGSEYYKADQFENSKDLLNRALKNAGTDKSAANYYLGMIALEEPNRQEAAKYFSQGISANPEYAYNYVGQGQIKLFSGDVKGAEADFKMARKYSKKDPALEIAIARAYNDVDPVKYEKQINKCVEKARRMNMENPHIYVFEGDVLRGKKDIGGAAAKYEMAKNYDPNFTPAYVKYANLFTQVNPDYAIRMLKDLLAVNPQSALGQRELANAYYNNKDYVNAFRQYDAYINNPAHFKNDESRYAFLLFYGQAYEKGYEYATKLLKEDPKNFTAQRYQFMNACQIPVMKDDLLPMAEALYKAHEANPKANQFAPIDYTLISQEFVTAKKTNEAIAVMQSAIKENPENPSFDKQLASLYVDANDIAKACDAYAEYLKKVEPGYNDYIQQALYAYFAGRTDIISNPAEAKRYFDIATENANKAAAMSDTQYKPVKILADIAVASAAEKDMKTIGAPLYEKAIKLLNAAPDPSRYKSDAAEIYSYLGNSYISVGNKTKAKEMFNEYLKLRPNDEAVRKFVGTL